MQIRVKVKIEHYSRDGKLKRVFTKESDLVLNNFGYLLRVFFYPIEYNQSYHIGGFVNEDGDSFEIVIGYDSLDWEYKTERIYQCEIGTGTTAPSASDYKLASFHNRANASIYSLDLLSDVIRITLRASVEATANVTINEVGLSVQTWGWNATVGQSQRRYILLFRDVLSEGISMLSGEYLAVYYTIEFTR